MKEHQEHPLNVVFLGEMCCRKHTKEMSPSLHRQPLDFGMQGAKLIMMRTSARIRKWFSTEMHFNFYITPKYFWHNPQLKETHAPNPVSRMGHSKGKGMSFEGRNYLMRMWFVAYFVQFHIYKPQNEYLKGFSFFHHHPWVYK